MKKVFIVFLLLVVMFVVAAVPASAATVYSLKNLPLVSGSTWILNDDYLNYGSYTFNVPFTCSGVSYSSISMAPGTYGYYQLKYDDTIVWSGSTPGSTRPNPDSSTPLPGTKGSWVNTKYKTISFSSSKTDFNALNTVNFITFLSDHAVLSDKYRKAGTYQFGSSWYYPSSSGSLDFSDSGSLYFGNNDSFSIGQCDFAGPTFYNSDGLKCVEFNGATWYYYNGDKSNGIPIQPPKIYFNEPLDSSYSVNNIYRLLQVNCSYVSSAPPQSSIILPGGSGDIDLPDDLGDIGEYVGLLRGSIGLLLANLGAIFSVFPPAIMNTVYGLLIMALLVSIFKLIRG